MKKTFISLLVITLLVYLTFIPGMADTGNISVFVDGNAVAFPDNAEPFTDENRRTLIPVRFVTEALGASVDWNTQTQEASISKGSTCIIVKINDRDIRVNGSTTTMDTVAITKNDRTFVPIRYIAEALGSKVEWNNTTKTVLITSLESINPENIKCLGSSGQAVIVTAESFDTPYATVHTFEKEGDRWKEHMPQFPAIIGKNGLTYNKVEGDKKSPIGVFSLRRCFGRYENPGTKLEFTQYQENDFWVDDKDSAFYNTYQKGAPNGRWNSAEDLYKVDNRYKYFVVIEYNTKDIIPGKGSAIFMHIWKDKNILTSGCTAMAEDKLMAIIKWLDPSKNPVIVQAPQSEIYNIQ